MSGLDHIAHALVKDSELGKAHPTDNIVMLWSLDKYAKDVSDKGTSKLIAEEMKYYKLAQNILTRDPAEAKEEQREDIMAIQREFKGVEGVLKLADILRETSKLARSHKMITNAAKGVDSVKIGAGGNLTELKLEDVIGGSKSLFKD